MNCYRIPSPGAITQAQADRIHAEAAVRGEQVAIDAEVIPDPSPLSRFITGLFHDLTSRAAAPEAEIEP